MSLKETIVDRLRSDGVDFTSVKIDKDADMNGEHATEVEIVTPRRTHWIKFADRNRSTAEAVANVVASYLTKEKNR